MVRKLDRLNPTNSSGIAFQRLWQTVCEQIEAQFADIQDQIDAIAAAQAAAAAAQATANTAQTTATTAQTTATSAQSTADTVKRDDGISTSWTSPGSILSATDAGSSATINIVAHTRKYSDGLSRVISAGSITGLNYSTTYYLYYDDANRTAGAKTFHATTNPNTALPGVAEGRTYCGTIATPAAGGTSTSGGVNPPTAGGGIQGSSVTDTP